MQLSDRSKPNEDVPVQSGCLPTLTDLIGACHSAALAQSPEYRFWATVCLLESLTVDHPSVAISSVFEVLDAPHAQTDGLFQRSPCGAIIKVDHRLHDDNDIGRIAAEITLTSDSQRRVYLIEAAALLLLEDACADLSPLFEQTCNQ
ncbi:hypothetical protein [Brevundimonas sp.]|uniref:hypothetical protein n=1 Tax=Brevundimonas sp. TaxID=1871086 RepID=UPI0028A07B71|nr:hypothetical protein [Brevundimonas sp.]